MEKKHLKDIIKLYLKRPAVNKSMACFLGALDTHCELVHKGVRDVALMMPYWSTIKHHQYLPMIRQIVKSYSLQLLSDPDLIDVKGNQYWVYYIYIKNAKRKVNELINLFKKVKQDKKNKTLHRKIGRLLGYSHSAIEQKYKK